MTALNWASHHLYPTFVEGDSKIIFFFISKGIVKYIKLISVPSLLLGLYGSKGLHMMPPKGL